LGTASTEVARPGLYDRALTCVSYPLPCLTGVVASR